MQKRASGGALTKYKRELVPLGEDKKKKERETRGRWVLYKNQEKQGRKGKTGLIGSLSPHGLNFCGRHTG